MMEVYKPRENRLSEKQKLNVRRNKPRPKGAVMKPKERLEEPLRVRIKKNVADFFSELERVTGFLDRRLAILSLVLLFAYGVYYAGENIKANMPIEKVSVKGDFKQLERRDLELTLSPLVGTNYFDLDIQEIKVSLLDYAWVQSVEVRKVWPAAVEVVVVENRAIATWGPESLVNEYGKVFKPESIQRELLTGLPDLNGQENQSDLVLETYVRLSGLSLQRELSIVRFALVAENYWQLEFKEGPEVLLPYGKEERALEVFLNAYVNDLVQTGKQLAKVDMRYTNGFSVLFSDKLNTKAVKMGMQDNVTPLNVKTGKNHG